MKRIATNTLIDFYHLRVQYLNTVPHNHELKYIEYAELIKAIDGVDLPEYKAPIDYDELKRKAAQEYFEILFDAEKRKALTARLLNAIDNPDVTTKQLLKVDIPFSLRINCSSLPKVWTPARIKPLLARTDRFISYIGRSNILSLQGA